MLLHQPLAIALIACIPLVGCSVGMALKGKKDPELTAIKKGASRHEIDMQLGDPLEEKTLLNGNKEAVYLVTLGQEGSTGRAVAHGVLDVFTLGLWEVVGTPVEVLKGSSFKLIITYNTQDDVISITKKKAD